MKKLALLFVLSLISFGVNAQTKISQMPNGGPTATADTIPVVRGGVNFQTQFPGPNSVTDLSNVTTGTHGVAGSALYQSTSGGITALTPATINGITNWSIPFFSAANLLFQITNGLEIDPRYYGASCNAGYFSAFNGWNTGVNVTMGSNVISINNYTFKAGLATQSGGGDVGKQISVMGFCDALTTTYIASVNLANNTATLGQNASCTEGNVQATMGGYPCEGVTGSCDATNPANARDDTVPIQNASLLAAAHGGHVILPPSCLVHNLRLATGTSLEGFDGGNAYGNFNGIHPNTTLYIGSTSYSDDIDTNTGVARNLGIDVRSYAASPNGGLLNVALRNFSFQSGPYDGAIGGSSGSQLACVGLNGQGDDVSPQHVFIEHVDFDQCPVGFGSPYGWNFPVSFTASVTGNQMTVSAISSTFPVVLTTGNPNFSTISDGTQTANLALGRTITGSGLGPTTLTIVGAPPGGGTGVYTLSRSASVGSESITSPVAYNFASGEVSDSEFVSDGIGMNGDMSDSSFTNDTFTGDVYGWYLGPNTASQGNGSQRVLGGRFEENQIGLVCDSCGIELTGTEFQFNSGYAIETKGVNNYLVQMTGGVMEGNVFSAASSTANRAQVGLHSAGNNNYMSFSNVFWSQVNVAINCCVHDEYIFDMLGSGANDQSIDIEGGNPGDAFNTAIGNPAFLASLPNKTYKVDAPGIQYINIDSVQKNIDANLSGTIGIGTAASATSTGAILDMSGATGAQSAFVLPGGTNGGTRPTTVVAGMERYNSATPGFEGFYNGTWNALLDQNTANIVHTVTPGVGISTSLTSGGSAAITTTGTVYADAGAFYGTKGGLVLSNDGVSPNTVIDVSPGSATDDSGTVLMKLALGVTKTTGTWTAGTGNGCLDTGTVGNGKWYHVFQIEKTNTTPPTVDILCSLSGGSPSLPANYGYKRDIGVFQTDGSAHILGFTWKGARYYRTTGRALEFTSTTLGTSAVLATLPDVPGGANVTPIGTFSLANTTSACVLLSSPFESDEAPSCTYPFTSEPGADALYQTTSGVITYALPTMNTNSNQQIRLRSSAANTTVAVNLRGFDYSFAPSSFSLNFLNGSLPSAVTFSRASPATYYNSSGILASTTTNTPRFDYDPGSLALKGLLIEHAATNLSPPDPRAGQWASNQTSLSVGSTSATTSPDGTTDAAIWTELLVSSTHRSIAFLTTLNATPYTFSGYAKKNTATTIQIQLATSAFVNYDLNAGTFTPSGSITGTMQPLPNGWYRITATATTGGTSTVPNVCLTNNNASSAVCPSYLGTGESLYLYGFQYELGSFASSYISAGARAVDSASVANPPLFNASSGSFTVQAMLEGKNTTRQTYTAAYSDGTTSNSLALLLSTSGQAQGGDTVAGTPFVSAGSAGAPALNAAFTQAMNYLSGSNTVTYNSTLDGAGTFGAAALPSGISTLQLGDREDGTLTLDGWLQSFNYSQ